MFWIKSRKFSRNIPWEVWEYSGEKEEQSERYKIFRSEKYENILWGVWKYSLKNTRIFWENSYGKNVVVAVVVDGQLWQKDS